jgi:hypothetical protein
MNLLSIVPWYYRWGAVALLFVAAAGFGAAKMHEHDQEKFDAFEAKVKAAGDRQNELTQQIIAIHKQEAEDAQAKAVKATRDRDAAVATSNKLLDAAASGRIVSAPRSGSGSDKRICFTDRDELDRGISERFARLSSRVIGAIQKAGGGVDVALLCHDWAPKR